MLLTGATEGYPVFIPSPAFCTDNAAMIACAAYHRYSLNPTYYQQENFLDLEARANLVLSNLAL
jgi:tRNA A37 threonylcarbamoyltransferase TsaD